MRIDTKKTIIDRAKWLKIIIILLAIGITGYYFKSLNTSNKNTSISNKRSVNYYCGAESYSDSHFINNGTSFSTNCQQSKEQKHEGSYSCKCDGNNRYGMTLILNDLSPNDKLEIHFMEFCKGCKTKLVISSDSGIYTEYPIKNSDSLSWTSLDYTFIIPADSDAKEWRIYPYKYKGEGPAYYDDFSVSVVVDSQSIAFAQLPKLELEINDENFKKIKKKREYALEKGLLFSSKKDMVPANLKIDSTVYGVNVRLKGDLLDHLQGQKWSFRIGLKNNSWNGLKTFSIHNSKARSHIAEWVMHQMLKDEGILTPKYDFCELVLNDIDVGVYAYEQYFDNNLLFYNNRLIAPIIKHNDDGYWDNVQGVIKNNDWVASSQIELFNKENEGNKNFMELFHYGHSQLYGFLNQEKKVEEVFDVDKMAKYYALIEIGHGLHAQLLTNIRFYINPTSSLLEPIGYDFFGDHLPNITEDWRPVGMWENGENIYQRSKDGEIYRHVLFANTDFFEKYMHYLKIYTSDNYLSSVKKKYAKQIKLREQWINSDKEYTGYRFNFDELFRKAKYTRAKIFPLANISLKTYRGDTKNEVVLQGFHYFPIEILGYTHKDKLYPFDQPIILAPYYPESPPDTRKFTAKAKPNRIVYKILGIDSIFYENINNTRFPNKEIVGLTQLLSPLTTHSSVLTSNNKLTFSAKEIVIDKPMFVDSKQTLMIGKGAIIRFKAKGSLRILGVVNAIGTVSEPIVFAGMRAKGQGVLISNSTKSNIFSYCVFQNLANYSVGAVVRQASVNIVESSVEFDNCIWKNNNAKYDLAQINAEFSIRNSYFMNNPGSAIESYYSTGDISNLDVNNYGDMFIDITGGKITGNKWKINHVLNTAIEVNQFGKLNITDFQLDSSHVALTAREQSQVYIKAYFPRQVYRDVEVYGAEKPQTKVTFSNFDKTSKPQYYVEDGSYLKINGVIKQMK